MLLKPELVKKIKDYFNLNIYETKVWLALVSKGVASAGEIAQISEVPRSRTYDVLESLEKQGFAMAKVGKPTKYIAVKPEMVLEKLKRNTMFSAEEKVKVLDNLKGTREYEELQELHNSAVSFVKREDITTSIKGRSNILSYARDIIENAEKEVVVCLPATDLIEKARIFSNLFERLKRENLVIKLALKGTDEELKKVHEKYGIKPIKTNLPSKFFMIDRKQVIFSLNDSGEDEIAVWLNSEFFSQALSSLFELSLRK
ncbi:MAG: hypothetical protein NT076_05270 [Candidatus Pacearchaeota archaeon]|nr:hypothetical protein [Candidatus Pacearchaeota archaeon]